MKKRHSEFCILKNFCFLGRGLTIVGSILEGDFKERADDVALAKEVRDIRRKCHMRKD